MSRAVRRPVHLNFKGWWVDGPEIRVQARMVALTAGNRWVETGPNLTLTIPADCLLDEDICEAAASAQHRDEKRRAFQAAFGDVPDEPLF